MEIGRIYFSIGILSALLMECGGYGSNTYTTVLVNLNVKSNDTITLNKLFGIGGIK